MRIEESREGGPEPESRSEEDRVVSRRVDNPTDATEEDERAYAAADPDPHPSPNHPTPDAAGTTERADRDLASESDEPTRSE
ncbi:hypothetical protein [Pseudonocardia lacus]|uniref:hypothetical protein n=1 Tax=Pseudonocardia lacus TaxID=2835865 RepID=UPI001BDCCBA0|nr:hypothetical protein [Pseudonocardia lacus]